MIDPLQGKMDELASVTASIATILDALDRVIDAGIRDQLQRMLIEMMRAKVRITREISRDSAALIQRIAA